MFAEEFGQAPYQVSEIFEYVNNSYWFCKTLTRTIMDEHAPTKKRVTKNNQVPFMTGDLRRAIKVKYVLEKFLQIETSANWKLYRKHRNHVVQLRKICAKDCSSQHTMKSYGGKDF